MSKRTRQSTSSWSTLNGWFGETPKYSLEIDQITKIVNNWVVCYRHFWKENIAIFHETAKRLKEERNRRLICEIEIEILHLGSMTLTCSIWMPRRCDESVASLPRPRRIRASSAGTWSWSFSPCFFLGTRCPFFSTHQFLERKFSCGRGALTPRTMERRA